MLRSRLGLLQPRRFRVRVFVIVSMSVTVRVPVTVIVTGVRVTAEHDQAEDVDHETAWERSETVATG